MTPVYARARDALAFEWTKLRSLRSNYLTLLIASVATLGATTIVAQTMAGVRAAPPPNSPIDAFITSFLGFAEYLTLPLSVLGVLVFTSEYSTGLIKTTFIVIPQRRVVLAAKAAVAGVISLLTGEVLAFACFLLTQLIFGTHRGLSLSHAGVLRGVLIAGVFLPACVLTAVGLAAILRHTAGAIASAIGAIYLLALICLALPAPWNTRIGQFTLPYAAYQAITLHPITELLSPGVSLLVMLAWPAATLLAAAIVIARRDA
ncbi:MAG TPA: ABC transporter permease [Streptosporangiaceae bacterium]|nr:ABC transporter permease [Streptosporangiaceae bacterium]